MYPYSYGYDPAGTPQYRYGVPAYRTRNDQQQYLQALAEEEAARRQYEQALRQQEEARTRAARARLARQAYEHPHYDSYLADDDDYGYHTAPRATPRAGYAAYPDYPYLTPQEQRALLQERQRMEQERREQQRRIEALERERELERQRIRALEEERKRRLLEEERRRRIMLEEEERQRRRDEERRRREEEELLRRSSSPAAATFLPLEELLGLRPSRSLQPEMNNARRARTMSPAHRGRAPHPATQPQRSQSKAPASPAPRAERASSRSPTLEPQPQTHRIPITSPKSSPKSAPKPSPTASQPQSQPQSQQQQRPRTPPRQYGPQEAEAAEKIQSFWRQHHTRRAALRAIAELTTKFEQLKSSFVLPPSLDYTLGGASVSVPTAGWDAAALATEVMREDGDAILAFTPANAPVHGYEEELNRILTRLDGVQSGGDETVRARRRALARRVEREAERVERMKVLIWRAYVERQRGAKEEREKEPQQERQEEMAVDEPKESAPAPEAPPSVEMQLDATGPTTQPSEPQDVDLTAEDVCVEPTAETTDVDITDAPPSEPAPQDADVADAQEPAEKMDVEPAPSEAMDSDESANPDATHTEPAHPEPENHEPADVELTDSAPRHPEAMDKQSHEDVVEMADNADPADPSEPAIRPEVPIIVEEPDPDADATPAASERAEVEDAEDVVEADAGEEPTEFLHAPLTASVTPSSPPPSPTASAPTDNSPVVVPVESPVVEHAPEQTSSPPGLVYSASEAGDSDHTPPHTPPPATHEQLAHTPRAGTPRPQMSSEKLQMLRPLVSEDWTEEADFF